MKRYLFIIILFSLISCKKETSVESLPVELAKPVRQEQLMTAEYLDGQILSEFSYDNFGKLIKEIHYRHPKNMAPDQLRKRIYNAKGIPIADSFWFLPVSSVNPDIYTTYEYDNKNECISQKDYFWPKTLFYSRTRNSIEYDSKGRTKKLEIKDFTNGNETIEYFYDNNNNIIKVLDDHGGDFVYEFNNELNLNYPLKYNFIINRNIDKNFCTKITSDIEKTTITILEKNAQGNPTKIRWDISWPNGTTQTDIYTYIYINKP